MRLAMRPDVCLLLAVLVLGIAPRAFGDGLPPSAPSTVAAGVTLPLEEYLGLIDRIERAEQARRKPPAPVIAELAMQATTVTIDGSVAEIDASYRVVLSGRPTRPFALPVTGLVASATVESLPKSAAGARGAALHRKSDALLLVAPEPGIYAVRARGWVELEGTDGEWTLQLAPSRAPVATLELDLPADLGWSGDHVVMVEDSHDAGRRRLRLAPERGQRPSFRIRHVAAGAVEAETRARAVMMTVARLGARGIERHDVVVYEVTRGELSRFTLALPELAEKDERLAIERAITDEGPALPVLDAGRLTIERQHRLAASGHLTLTFRPASPVLDAVPLPALTPVVPVRSRYLVLASDRAGEVEPRPAEAWSRVDLEDLPRGTRTQVAALAPSSVWRRTETAAEPWLRVQLYDPVDALPAVVGQRSTSSILTVDGSLVHRDVFDLHRAGASLQLSLHSGATLWSVTVDGQAVRPIERGSEVAVPLAFKAEGKTRVELVSVETRQFERGASRIELELPRVASPVLEHQWRLLLPERHRYRFAASDLGPAPPDAAQRPRAVSESRESVIDSVSGDAGIVGEVTYDSDSALPGVMVTVTGGSGKPRSVASNVDGSFHFLNLASGSYRLVAELEGFRTLRRTVWVPAGRTARVELAMPLSEVVEEIVVTSSYSRIDSRSTVQLRNEIEGRQRQRAAQVELRSLQGLVGGVKPLAVEIPESGKLLLLAGVLPPPSVRVELEVRAKR